MKKFLLFVSIFVSCRAFADINLDTPADNATIIPLNVAFSWGYLGPANAVCRLQISLNSSFTAIYLDTAGVYGYTAAMLPDSMTFFWRAAVWLDTGFVWSVSRVFHTLPRGSALCPWSIGNRWYYRASSLTDASLIGMVKEIVAISPSRVCSVAVTNVRTDSRLSGPMEYWYDGYGKLYASKDASGLVSIYSMPVYDSSFLKDTVLGSYRFYFSYSQVKVEMWGNTYDAQMMENGYRGSYGSIARTIAVPGIGLFSRYYFESSSTYILDSSMLVGMLKNGVVYGDTSLRLTNTPDNELGKTGNLPAAVALKQNYPNPSNPTTTIEYELPKSSEVKLSVYDMLGREVATLVNERRDAGVHEVKFDGTGLSSGVYFYRMQAGEIVQTKRLLLLR